MTGLGCAVLGVGAWGRLLADQTAQTAGLELVGVGDADRAHAETVAAHLGVRAYADVEAALGDDAVAAVMIAVPNRLHAAIAQRAIAANKHVLLEKPMALTVADANAVHQAATDAGVVLMLDHIQRYYAPLVDLRKLVGDGVLGEVYAVALSRRDRLRRTNSWLQQRESVGGLLYQSACHEYDLLRWLCGDATQIYCLAAPQVIATEPLNYPDMVLSSVRFRSGAVAQVWNCMTDPLMGYDGNVTGSEGSAWFDLYRGSLRWRRMEGEEQRRDWDPPDQWAPWAWIDGGSIAAGEASALHALLRDFRDAIEGRAPTPISGDDGLKVVEMAQAGYMSLADGRPVQLPLEGDDRARSTFLELEIPSGMGAAGND